MVGHAYDALRLRRFCNSGGKIHWWLVTMAAPLCTRPTITVLRSVLPSDCVDLVGEWLPCVPATGCQGCNECLVATDARGRLHFALCIVACGEAVYCTACAAEMLGTAS